MNETLQRYSVWYPVASGGWDNEEVEAASPEDACARLNIYKGVNAHPRNARVVEMVNVQKPVNAP